MYKYLLITLLLTITCFLSSCERAKMSPVLPHTEIGADVLVTEIFKLDGTQQIGNATFHYRSEDATVNARPYCVGPHPRFTCYTSA